MRLKIGESVKTLIQMLKNTRQYFFKCDFLPWCTNFQMWAVLCVCSVALKAHTALQWMHFPLLLCSAWAKGCWYRSVMRWQWHRPHTSCSVSSWVALQCVLKIQWKSLQDILLALILVKNCSGYNLSSSWRWGQCVTCVGFLWYMLKHVPVVLPRSIVKGSLALLMALFWRL